MTFVTLASGSDANAYLLCDDTATIQLECGLSFSKAMAKTHHELPDALLVTHEHADHARGVRKYLKRGVDVWMTRGTAEALGLPEKYNLHYLIRNKTHEICGHKVLVLPTIHDASEPVCFVIDGKILFVTDTGSVDHISGSFEQIFIEANYEQHRLFYSDISCGNRERILQNHLSIRQVCRFLEGLCSKPREVVLLHISKRHGDPKEFTRRITESANITNVTSA